MFDIKKAVVLGSGVMGGAIAIHLANAGLRVILLDITIPDLSTKAKLFYTQENIELISLGTFEENLDTISDADWIIEAIVEDEHIKKELYRKVSPLLNEHAIISSNTSSISIKSLSQGLPANIQPRFLGTHFFNPPRYMKLLEIIPSAETDKRVIDYMISFCEKKLGKGIVLAKDTPGFIANRIGIYSLATVIQKGIEHQLTFEEVDALTGTEIGRPKTGTFRLLDLIGNDTVLNVAQYLQDNILDRKEKEILNLPSYYKTMVKQGLYGDKSQGGFYQKQGKETLVLDVNTFTYRSKKEIKLDELSQTKETKKLEEKLQHLVYGDSPVQRFIWEVVKETVLFAGHLLPEIAEDIKDIDNAMKWGYNWEVGPFELWDMIGVTRSVAKIQAEGGEIPAVAKELLAKGKEKFYDTVEINISNPKITTNMLKAQGKIILKNSHGSLVDYGDNIACFLLHSPNSAITDQVIDIINQSLEEVEKNYHAMIISGVGKNFCVGADLSLVLHNAKEKKWKVLEKLVRDFQNLNMALKYAKRPVVGAPYHLTLGGGAEIILHCSKVISLGELYMGLVEIGVGLLPAGGGTKELLVRATETINHNPRIDVTPFILNAFETIALAKVSTSEPDAKKLGLLGSVDQLVMNKDLQLSAAKESSIVLAEKYTQKTKNKKYRVGGEGLYSLILYNLYQMYRAGYISQYDKYLASKIGYILCGGKVPNNTLVSEQYLLDLEREAFISLCGEQKTQDRIEYMHKSKKPLRN